MRIYGLLILTTFLISVYTLTSAGKFHIVDEVSLFALTESAALRWEADTNAIAWTQWVNSSGEVLGEFGRDDEVYSKKGAAPAIFAVPWYWLLRAFALSDFHFGILQATLLWNGFVTAATAALLWLTATRLDYTDRVGMQLGLLYGLCTIAWPYANHFFGEPLSAFSLLLTFYGLVTWQARKQMGWIWLAGIGASIAVATSAAHLILVAVLSLYSLHTLRKNDGKRAHGATAFITPILITGLLLIAYNDVRFDDLLKTGYHFTAGEGFTTPLLQGAWGLLFSPYRSLFLHTPLLFLMPLGLIAFSRRHRAEGVMITALSTALIVLYSMWWMWWGGFAWGPRFLVPLTPFWVLTFAPLLARDRETDSSSKNLVFIILPLALLSFCVQLLAVLFNYVNYEILLRYRFPTDLADPLAYGPPAQNLSDFQYSPIFGQIHLLRENLWANLDLAWIWRTAGEQAIHVHWPVAGLGAATLIIGVVTLIHYTKRLSVHKKPNFFLKTWFLLPLLTCILIPTWINAASQNPHYGQPEQGYRAVLAQICQQSSAELENSVIITVAPTVYQVAMNWLPVLCDQPPPIYGYATSSADHPEVQRKLEMLLADYERIWFVTGGLPPHDPNNSVERWLADNSYQAGAEWYDDYRLLQYGTSRPVEAHVIEAPLLDQTSSLPLITVQAARMPSTTVAGAILPIDIIYQVNETALPDLRWFVQLWNEQGMPVAFLDSAPQDGYGSFGTLQNEQGGDQEWVEMAGLLVPADAPAGLYRVIAGLYNPAADGQRLQTATGDDFVELGQVEIQRP